MKSIKRSTLILFLVIFFSSNLLYSQTKYSYWISIEYLKCLSTSLPCQCNNINSKYSFAITESNQEQISSFWNKDINVNEIEEYKTIKNKNKKFATTLGIIHVIGDTLTLKTKKKVIKYLYFKLSDTFNENYNAIKNLELIDNSINNINNKSIYDFVPIGSGCECNNELSKINLISQIGISKSWVLEKNEVKRQLFLYEVINIDEGKQINFKLNKKLLYSFKY